MPAPVGGVGKVCWKRVYELAIASRVARRKPGINLLPLEEEEWVSAVLTVREYSEEQHIFFTTRNGMVKKKPHWQISLNHLLTA